MTLYPLRFEPIFKSMLWGGRRLPAFLNREAPHADPIGEAWVLSDVDGNQSRVADGPLAGTTLRELLARDPARSSVPQMHPHGKFPLLLKFIDARQELSVQVHPNDEQAAKLGPGNFGKTEAWVILDRARTPARSTRASLRALAADHFRTALAAKDRRRERSTVSRPNRATVCSSKRARFTPSVRTSCSSKCNRPATSPIGSTTGTAWMRRPGKPRQLHVDEGLSCADFGRGPCPPVGPAIAISEGVRRESLVDCRYFTSRPENEPVAVPRRREGRMPRGRLRARFRRDRIAREALPVRNRRHCAIASRGRRVRLPTRP